MRAIETQNIAIFPYVAITCSAKEHTPIFDSVELEIAISDVNYQAIRVPLIEGGVQYSRQDGLTIFGKIQVFPYLTQ